MPGHMKCKVVEHSISAISCSQQVSYEPGHPSIASNRITTTCQNQDGHNKPFYFDLQTTSLHLYHAIWIFSKHVANKLLTHLDMGSGQEHIHLLRFITPASFEGIWIPCNLVCIKSIVISNCPGTGTLIVFLDEIPPIISYSQDSPKAKEKRLKFNCFYVPLAWNSKQANNMMEIVHMLIISSLLQHLQ